MPRILFVLCLTSWLTLPGAGVHAQDDEEDLEAEAEAEGGEAAAEDPAEAELGTEGDDATTSAEDSDAAAASGTAPTWWVGPYVQGVLVPSFMLKLFLDASPSVFNPAFGATVTHRNAEGFSWILGFGYTGYGFDGPFQISGDPVVDTEYVDSSLGLLHVRGQLMWSANLSETLDFEYGVGIDLGVVLGKMMRSEAWQDAGGAFHPCAGPGNPPVFSGAVPFCEPPTNPLATTNAYDEEGAHYNVEEERVPPIAGSIMLPALALRYTPIPKLAIKLEAAFGILQFSFGLSASYGIGS